MERLWSAALGRLTPTDFQSSQGNKRRVQFYDALIGEIEHRADMAETLAARREHMELAARLEARCKREVQRREDQTRRFG